MPTLKIKLKVNNAEIEITADGQLDKETLNTLKSLLLPITSALGNNQSFDNQSLQTHDIVVHDVEKSASTSSLYSKFKALVISLFKHGEWFTSLDVREAFQDSYGILLKPSTIATYLRRMEAEGLLRSRKRGRMIEYQVLQLAEVTIPGL